MDFIWKSVYYTSPASVAADNSAQQIQIKSNILNVNANTTNANAASNSYNYAAQYMNRANTTMTPLTIKRQSQQPTQNVRTPPSPLLALQVQPEPPQPLTILETLKRMNGKIYPEPI
jgi:cell division septation protein DedD